MKPTASFLADCKGLAFNADLRCFTDPVDNTNWWIDTQRGGFVLVNRDIGVDVDAEFAAEVLAATSERGGALVRKNGTTADVTIKFGRPQIKKG